MAAIEASKRSSDIAWAAGVAKQNARDFIQRRLTTPTVRFVYALKYLFIALRQPTANPLLFHSHPTPNLLLSHPYPTPTISIMNDVILNRRVTILDKEALIDAKRSLSVMLNDFLQQHKPKLTENERKRLARYWLLADI